MKAELKIHIYPYDSIEVREQKRAAKKAFAELHKNVPVRKLGMPRSAQTHLIAFSQRPKEKNIQY